MFNWIGFISALVGNCQDTQLFPIGFQSYIYILVDMINIGFKYDWFHLPISLVFVDWWVIARTLSCPSVDCGQFARSRHRGHAALSDRCQVSVEHVVFECVRMIDIGTLHIFPPLNWQEISSKLDVFQQLSPSNYPSKSLSWIL